MPEFAVGDWVVFDPMTNSAGYTRTPPLGLAKVVGGDIAGTYSIRSESDQMEYSVWECDLKPSKHEPRPKLSELGLGAVIRDNADGTLFVQGTAKNYGEFGSPYDGEVTGESPIWRELGGEVAQGRLIDDFTVLYEGVKE